MFLVTSDLALVLRRELPVADTNNPILASGLMGVWVTINSDGNAALPSAGGGFTWPVWNESNRDGTVGWTKDVTNAKRVTVLVGKFFATTDQFDDTVTISQGDALKVAATGKLVKQAGSGVIVAYCVAKKTNQSYMDRTGLTLLDIETV